MSTDARVRAYWREEHALIVVLLVFFVGIVVFSFQSPFDARLFPLVIGGAGIILTIIVAVEPLRRHRGDAASALEEGDPAGKAGWRRFATALLSAPAFAIAFWLLGFVVASLAAMLLMPALMGYRNLPRLAAVAVVTVAILAFAAPHLLQVSLPNGFLVEWLIDRLRPS